METNFNPLTDYVPLAERVKGTKYEGKVTDRFITDSATGLTLQNTIKRSVFIEAREWFDKTGGNSYFSARIQVDGKLVATLPFQYGYGDSYLYEAATVLKDMGYLPDDSSALWVHAKDMGFDYYAIKTETKKSEMFK